MTQDKRPRGIDLNEQCPARLGLLLGIRWCCLGPEPLPKRPIFVLKDRFGGRLTIQVPSPKHLRLWRAGIAQTRHNKADPVYLFAYEVDGTWGQSLSWWLHLMGHARLAMYALQIAGPFDGLPEYVCYASLKGEDHTFFQCHQPSRFDPDMMSAWGYFKNVNGKRTFEQVRNLCRLLFSAFGDEHDWRYSRYRSKDAVRERGSRLETAIELYSQAMKPTYMQDTCLRLHIALESLFQARGLGRTTAMLVAAMILARRIPPEETRRLWSSIDGWRNRFVHGDSPPFQYPPSSRFTRDVMESTRNGTLLLRSLFQEILASADLIAIFNKRTKEDDFKSQLFEYVLKRIKR